MAMYAGPPVGYPMPMMMMQPAPIHMVGNFPMNIMAPYNLAMPMPFFPPIGSPEPGSPEPEEPKKEEPVVVTQEKKPVVVMQSAGMGCGPPKKKKAGCSVCGSGECHVTTAVEREDREGLEVLRMTLHRKDAAAEWGLELTSDTDHSLTVTALTGSARQRRWDGDVCHRIGDVCVGVLNVNGQWDRTKPGMVAMLKSQCAVQCEFVHAAEFVATLKKGSVDEPLHLDVEATKDGRLLVAKVRSVTSCATKYNEDFYERPLVAGDTILAVNGATEVQEMVKELRAQTELNLKVHR